jgi:hypothetical protein
MKLALILLAPLFLILLVSLPADAVPGDGPPPPLLKLDVKPDIPVQAGDVIKARLTNGFEGDKAFLFIGERRSPFAVRHWHLGLIPTDVIHLGVFPATGVLHHKYKVPGHLPPSVSGLVLHMQGASVGKRPHHTRFWAESNLDGIKFR